MAAYMCLNDVPASGNPWLLQDVLRRDLGFKGFVISDSYTIDALKSHACDNNLLLGHVNAIEQEYNSEQVP